MAKELYLQSEFERGWHKLYVC